MNWYKLLFFHIFKRYYKGGEYKSDILWLTAIVIVAVPSSFYLLTIVGCFYYFFINENIPTLNENAIIVYGFVFVSINCLWIIHNEQYLKIYNEYKLSSRNTKMIEIFSWVYVVVGFILIPILALIFRP